MYPDAPLASLGDWAGFDSTCWCKFLDPLDPLYTEIQKKFIAKQTEFYGTDHIYGIDIFNELIPPSWEPEYLARVSRQVYESLEAADPQAKWLEMAWRLLADSVYNKVSSPGQTVRINQRPTYKYNNIVLLDVLDNLIDTVEVSRTRHFDIVNVTRQLLGNYFDEVAYHKRICAYEGQWWRERYGTFPAKPEGDAVKIAREITEKYREQLEKRYR